VPLQHKAVALVPVRNLVVVVVDLVVMKAKAVARVPSHNRVAVTVALALDSVLMVDTVEVPSKAVLIMVLIMALIMVLVASMVTLMAVVDSDTALGINNRLPRRDNMSGEDLSVMAAILTQSLVFAIIAPSAKILTCARIVKAKECTPVIIL